MTDTYDSDRADGAGFNTVMLHHGQTLDPEHRARAPPIYASTSFAFEVRFLPVTNAAVARDVNSHSCLPSCCPPLSPQDSAHGADLFALKKLGPIYTRIMNPTSHVLEYRIAKLEGSKCNLDGGHPSALATSSGLAAQMQALLTFVQDGDSIIAASNLYGGTYAQFKHTFKGFGITVKFIDGNDMAALQAAFDETTKAVYYESISNPSYEVPDFEAISAICKKNQVPLVVDNTFGMCGYTCRPIKFGADIVVESCTKWIGGHGNTIGGIIVDANTFDWSVTKADGTKKFPLIADPCPGYHGMNFQEVFGPTGPFKCNMAFIFAARVVSLRDMGGCPNPFGSFQLLMGLETLSLRGARHSENANKLAAWLEQDPRVAWVSHLSLPAHNSHEKAKKYFRTGTFGAVLSFGVKGGAKAAALVIDSVKLATHLANVGDAKTLVIQPAATTHQQLTEQEQIDCGVKPDMIRVSVGIETIADIIADFDQALSAKPAAAAAAAVEDAEVKGLDTEVKPDESCCSIV